MIFFTCATAIDNCAPGWPLNGAEAGLPMSILGTSQMTPVGQSTYFTFNEIDSNIAKKLSGHLQGANNRWTLALYYYWPGQNELQLGARIFAQSTNAAQCPEDVGQGNWLVDHDNDENTAMQAASFTVECWQGQSPSPPPPSPPLPDPDCNPGTWGFYASSDNCEELFCANKYGANSDAYSQCLSINELFSTCADFAQPACCWGGCTCDPDPCGG
jgi:hypothetical protein